ncbi:tyrosine recombinase XerD [Proteobacteria bacterium CAG:495]|nr:tyrosine recombinase XerD [Proteobacteria bacterium CAG:495]
MMRAEVGASANTIDAYRRDLEQFEALCRFQDYKDIKGEDIAGYVQELNRQSYAAKSVARKLSAVRDFFKFLYTEKVIKKNPTTDILTPKQEKPLPKYLTPEEVRLLIAGGSRGCNRSGRSRRKPGTAAAGGDAGTDVCLRFARVGAGVSA